MDIRLVEKLIEEDLVGYIKGKAFILVHNPLYYQGSWYYQLGTGDFIYSTSPKGHLDDPAFDRLIGKPNKIRGRVAQYGGIIFVVIYLDPDLSSVTHLSEKVLLDIKYRIEAVSGKIVDYIFDDSGNTLQERKIIDEH